MRDQVRVMIVIRVRDTVRDRVIVRVKNRVRVRVWLLAFRFIVR